MKLQILILMMFLIPQEVSAQTRIVLPPGDSVAIVTAKQVGKGPMRADTTWVIAKDSIIYVPVPPDTTPPVPPVPPVVGVRIDPTQVLGAKVGDSLRFNAQAIDSTGAIVQVPDTAARTLSYSTSDTAVIIGPTTGVGYVRAVPRAQPVIVTLNSIYGPSTASVTVELPPVTGDLTPANIRATLGPVVKRGTSPTSEITTYDQRYTATEQARFNDYQATGPSFNIISGNHYGGLRSRLMWSIRNGEPYGQGVTSLSTAYGRGRKIVRDYLQIYGKPNQYRIPPHNNTGLADIEAYYVLEGDNDARDHIWMSAQQSIHDPYGYNSCVASQSDARIPTIGLQATSAAHRQSVPYHNTPFAPNAAVGYNRGSWLAEARNLITVMVAGCVKPDGSIPSPSHGRQEAFLFNAMMAAQLLQFHGWVEPNATAYDAAKRIVDHLLAVDAQKQAQGWSTLPYTSGDGAPAEDLAAYYVWPALVLWQETGDAKYRTFALRHIAASNRGFIGAMKQFNQVFSTLGQGAEALLSGVRWR